MKKKFTLIALLLFCLKGFSQNTYYWVGGAGPASFTSNSNWNTMLDGTGDSRSVAGAMDNDVLIFDGSTSANVVLTASGDTAGRMIFQNNINVKFSRSSAGSANISIMGDGTAAPDFVINSGSVVTLGDEIYNYNARILLGLPTVPTTATGLVSGILYLSPLSQTIHTASYITSLVNDGLVFTSGAECHVTDSTSASPFNGSANGSVLFQSGSSLHYYSGRSPFGNSSTVQFANFEPGSNFYVKGSNISYIDGTTSYSSSSWANLKSFSNVFIQNGATYRCDGPVYRIDDLNIAAGAGFVTHTSGYTPVLGNLTVDGTLNAVSGSNSLVMGGESLQTISGTGTIAIPNFVVGDNSNVLLNNTISVSSNANIVGDLDFGATGSITGAGVFTSRVASATITGTGSTIEGSYQISYPSPGIFTGYAISGPGIAPNTNVVGFGASANSVYLSKPALSTQSNVSFDFTTDTALLKTANPNGFDETTGSVTVTGTRNFQSGTDYIINAATMYPFGISSSATGSVTIGNLILNAPVTTNYNCRIAGLLTMNAGNFSIKADDTVRISSGADIIGAPFSAAKYIVSLPGTGSAGVLRIDNFNSSKLFPVGNSSHYLPVTLTPVEISDFAVSVFEGATQDGTIGGTPMTALQKTDMVDAVWTIDRINGTGECNTFIQWVDPLEGSSFTSLPDNQIGASRYDGTTWLPAAGTADNTGNTVSASFSEFSPFIVSKTMGVVPVHLINVYATPTAAGTIIKWILADNQDDEVLRYEVEKSNNQVHFTTVANKNPARLSQYEVVDNAVASGIQYYRLKIVYINGSVKYSEILVVRYTINKDIVLYPNPVKDHINVSGISKQGTLRIINSAGNVILQQKVAAGTISLEAGLIAPGMYQLEIITENAERSVQRFIKL